MCTFIRNMSDFTKRKRVIPFENLKEEKGKNGEKTGIRQEDEREPAGGKKKEGYKKRRAMCPPLAFFRMNYFR